MPHVIRCIATAHDLRLVAIACVICAIGALATLQMLARAQASDGGLKWAWIGAGGIAFGCGVWVTHFVAMLAYQPSLPMAFDIGLTWLSLFVAMTGGTLALACARAETPGSMMVGGVVMGATIGVMHFSGMAALRVPGVLQFGVTDVVAAWGTGLALAPLALARFQKGRLVEAVTLLVLAVAGLHFTAMAALSILPDQSILRGIDKTSLAVVVSALGFLVLFAGLATALVDRHLERRAARENARFRRFADATFEGLFFLDRGVVSDVNTVICRMLGRAPEQIIGAPVLSFIAPEFRQTFEAPRPEAAGGMELELIDAAGDRRVVDVLARSLVPGDESSRVIAVRDATERKRAERQIRELARTDPLTGLSNRLRLDHELDEALAAARRSDAPLAVLCIDLDHFKAVNDRLGHHAGDMVLIEVARRLRAETRDGDIVARLGGDEFIVARALDGHDSTAEALGARLVDVLCAPCTIDDRQVEVSASIGIALYPRDADRAETLLKQADLALYRAKHQGRRCHRFFEPAMDATLREHRALGHDLRQALGRGEMYLEYQPIFSGDGLELTGYEALLRWRHPRRGAVPPALFIPIAEESGAIVEIGRWVLETACAESARWPGHPSVSVNVSPAQFNQHDLAGGIAEILARTGLPADRLVLEVTEGVLIGDNARALSILSALRARGIRIALDDFGTGYASLSYLRRFRFDRLKIDRAFVRELGVDPDADAFPRAIIAMAHSLRLEVTAEGVETEAQLEILRALRCDHLQGFLLGRPGPVTTPTRAGRVSVAAA